MKTKVVIIGGGPGGATTALYLLREGITPVIIEKESFPRFHIGESMTGECGAIVRDLGLEKEMLKSRHPQKQGVKVLGNNSWWVPVMAREKDGQLTDQFTWQVRRSEFDRMLLDTAIARGAKLINGQATTPLVGDDGEVVGVEVRLSDGKTMKINSDLVVDCSGLQTFLANAGVTGPKYIGNYDRQLAIYSQIEGGIRGQGSSRDTHPDNTLIFYGGKYHWAWWIPISDELTSVGVVTPAERFLEQKESKKAFLTRELHELHPELAKRIPTVKLAEDVRATTNYSYQVKRFSGKGFVCIGDAHRFLDPIFSFGLYVAMKEAQLVAPRIAGYLNGEGRDQPNPFADYQRHVEQGIDVLEDALDGFWEHPFAFALLVHQKYVEDMIDVFAGRIYDNQPSKATSAFRTLLERDRVYDSEEVYSMPIGSRYHPERAKIWVQDSTGVNLLAER